MRGVTPFGPRVRRYSRGRESFDPRGRIRRRLSIPNREVEQARRDFVERSCWRSDTRAVDTFLDCFPVPECPGDLKLAVVIKGKEVRAAAA